MLTKEEENMRRAERKDRLIENCTFAGLILGGLMSATGVILNAQYTCDRTKYPVIECNEPWDMSMIYTGLGIAGATFIASACYNLYEQKRTKKAFEDALKER